MAVLGEDGRGYELAKKLETLGIWRSWLGESLYSSFVHSLSSPSSWEAFMSSDGSKTKSQIQLQLRARALLFDKAASVSLFHSLSSSSSSSSSSTALVSSLNHSYLQLHGDDVYFTLEDAPAAPGPSNKRGRQEDFPETWYNKFIETFKAGKPYNLSSANQESRRNPSEMSNYLKLLERHKRRKTEFKEGEYRGAGNTNLDNRSLPGVVWDGDTSDDDSTYFFPETMFRMNCVPDSALPPRAAEDDKQKGEAFGVLDTLPHVKTKRPSSIMLERLGIRPEHISMEQGPGHSRTKDRLDGNRRQLGQEQALLMSKKVVSRFLTNVGFEGATEMPVEVLSQFLSCHISKLGRILKVLADSYRKQRSAVELLKMFLQVAGNSNLAALSEVVKENRSTLQPSSPQIQNMQSPPPFSPQNTVQLPQQIPRQMHPQIPQMVHPPNFTVQQQQQLLRRRQASSPRPMGMDKMVEVKLENLPDLPMDSNLLSVSNNRQAQMLRQQQFAALQLQKFGGSSGAQMRQTTPMHISQMQQQNVGVRAPPMKVEGFQELMGGDSSLKQTPEDSKLTSPK